MKRYLVSAVFLGLVACGTPQQQCIASVTRDLSVVDRLIAETQGNVDRGYAFATVVETSMDYVDCTPDPTPKHRHPRVAHCWQEVPQSVSRPVAIDLSAESAKLVSLQAKRKQLATAAGPSIAACQRQYPK